LGKNTDEACDVDFLTSENLRPNEVYDRMWSERQQQESSANATNDATNVSRGGGTGPWLGNVPCMHIIMCLTEDAVMSLFLARANTLLQAELDARNSSSR
jgi:hypothetical protein